VTTAKRGWRLLANALIDRGEVLAARAGGADADGHSRGRQDKALELLEKAVGLKEQART
jgi:hypothetical protein